MHAVLRMWPWRIAIAIVFVAVPVVRAQTTALRPAAASLVHPSSLTKAPNAEGFLQRWLILEPVRIPGQLTESAVRTAVGNEEFQRQLVALPREGEMVKVGDVQLAWHAVDTLAYNVNLYHFAYALDRPTSNVLFSVATVVTAPREMTDVRLAIGSNAASVWWLNGREVIAIYNDRQTVIDDGVSKRLTLKAGANVIRGAILNAGGATDFCVRFLDADDRPVKGLTVSLAGR